MIRAFVAIQIPEQVKASLVAAQAGLTCGRIVPPENFHITLSFLGEHPEPLLEDVHLLLDEVRAEPFEIAINGIGAFGASPPRAVYAAVSPNQALSHLRKKVARIAREAGINLPGEKFVPHVTLARFNREIAPDNLIGLERYLGERTRLVAAPFEVRAFALLRSTLGKRAPAYDVLAEYPLGDDARLSG